MINKKEIEIKKENIIGKICDLAIKYEYNLFRGISEVKSKATYNYRIINDFLLSNDDEIIKLIKEDK